MRTEVQDRPMWLTLAAMLVAAALALWLLIRPELLSGLPMFLRMPAIGLGVWALGAAFMQPLGLEFRRHWLRRVTNPPWNWAVLGAFAVIVVVRAFWLA
ncbi:hypothetical protein HOP51_05620 [Halomonas sp. MCCC 1A11036]|uniref:Uncharacterized protein n=1 Tax=Billgrantia zhangzhouensis TaxID=2733481 RepID=A0ABS9ACU0_9GAMM|nr:hypothetical protein [Halomonas zhangzhouensis]MCE8019600.1 hypothetical protein [Halomonas zhangzhouensis]